MIPRGLLRSAGAWHGLVLSGAMIAAGALDYAVNVVTGRWLTPLDFGVFVSVMALVQVLTLLTIAVRMVVALQVATLAVHPAHAAAVGDFARDAWRWSWRWGAVTSCAILLASPLLARALRLPDRLPIAIASAMAVLVFPREAAFGILQGTQRFGALGLTQVAQALLRLLLSAGLVALGWRAPGAVLAQPLSAAACLALAVWCLEPLRKPRRARAAAAVRWQHALATVVGLAVFGVLTNLDALFVKHYFSPRAAGDYGPVVTLAKICLFLPWALGLVLFPKVARRRAAGIDPRPLLLLALAAALAPGLALSAAYFAAPGQVVRLVFTSAYGDPGVVLGLAGLAASLQAGAHIWLNYALSLERRSYVWALGGVLGLQLLAMLAVGRSDLVHMTAVMVVGALTANLAGAAFTWAPSPVVAPRSPAPVAVPQ